MVTVEALDQDFQDKITVGKHTFILDSAIDLQGGDMGPSPHDILTASLLSCKSMTMRMYAKRKGWNVTGVRLSGKQVRIDRHHTRFEVTIELPQHLQEEERNRLIDISKKCPVHRALEGQIEIITHIGSIG